MLSGGGCKIYISSLSSCFSFRPLLDERGKKRWELLICDTNRTFEYNEFFPNNKINSVTLKAALEKIFALPGARRPDKVRFFRGQMQTIITRALDELDIKSIPSRRCFGLIDWLDTRMQSVYPQMPGYDEKSPTLFTMETGVVEDLPDALRGERWSFVQLPLSMVVDEMKGVRKGKVFGSTIPLDLAGIDQARLEQDPLVPGVAVFSRRALPLAGWTNGLELARMKVENDKGCLVLETGVNQRWRYSSYPRTPQAREEASAWAQAVQEAQGLHFLAIQEDEEADEVSGMWLMRDYEMPKI